MAINSKTLLTTYAGQKRMHRLNFDGVPFGVLNAFVEREVHRARTLGAAMLLAEAGVIDAAAYDAEVNEIEHWGAGNV